MSPSECQELAEFMTAAFERQKADLRQTLEAFREEVIEETRRVAEVTVETLRSEIQIVVEGVTANRIRIEENGRKIEENGRRIQQNRWLIEQNGRRIDALAARFDGVENRIANHEARLNSME